MTTATSIYVIPEDEKSDWVDYDPLYHSCDNCLVNSSCDRKLHEECVILHIQSRIGLSKTTIYGGKIKRIRFRTLKDSEILTDVLYDLDVPPGGSSSVLDVVKMYYK